MAVHAFTSPVADPRRRSRPAGRPVSNGGTR